MPVAVFIVGCAFKTEKFSTNVFGNMLVVSLGVAIASYGEAGQLARSIMACAPAAQPCMSELASASRVLFFCPAAVAPLLSTEGLRRSPSGLHMVRCLP